MRAKTVLAILFVFSLLVLAIAGAQMAQKGSANKPKEYILAATMPLPVGTLLRAQDVSWQAAVSELESDAILRPNAAAVAEKPEIVEETMVSVYGAVLRHPLVAGAPIRRSDIVKPGDRDFLQVVLTPGSRAIAIPVATGGASTGLLSPGDRVNVILTQNFKNDQSQELKNTPLTRRSVSETVVENLRVLAIDAPDIKPTGAANAANGNFGRTVTLEVTDDQAEQINVATELGKLSLTLRGADQTRFVSASPTPSSSDRVEGGVKPQWAGDVSPALFAAPQEKPIALAPLSVQVFHGAGKDGERFNSASTQGNVRSETVKPEN